MATLKGRKLTDADKAQKAARRAETQAVRAYTEYIEQSKHVRKRDPEKVQARLELVQRGIAEGFDPDVKGNGVPLPAIRRLLLIQESIDLQKEIDSFSDNSDDNSEELEAAFVTAALPWAQRQKYPVGYAAMRAFGITPDVLKRAGFKRNT